jgi:hypothetical protein
MTDKVNGGIGSKETLTGDMDFFTIHTVAALEEGAYGAVNSATRNLIRLVETISLGAQPVLVSVTEAVVDLSVAGNRAIYGLGSGFDQAGTTVYTMKFAIEHTGAFGSLAEAVDVAVPQSLAKKLEGLAMPFGSVAALNVSSATAANTSVTAFAVL